eukprot:CAMPEP_0183364364 /NCGR_PEP_ID=MMETSP0164_2-20130417/79741_1 /TAXON_ID=221442 /ORGANISM="Coccolithus pelagicus ssp braarudi, Strain PLY182g" /LENGTH=49 /DNA_ID= /DNA_START= /DNA_END= /DNA_ORIENTATION=
MRPRNRELLLLSYSEHVRTSLHVQLHRAALEQLLVFSASPNDANLDVGR